MTVSLRIAAILGVGFLVFLNSAGAVSQEPQVVQDSQASSATPRPQEAPLIIKADTVSELREWDSLVDNLERGGQLVRRAVYDDWFLPGRRHERFSQYYRGVPVYGGDVSRQTDRGATVSIFGTIHRIDIDPTPGLSPDDAREALESAYGVALVRGPTLFVLPRLDGNYALVYRATMANAKTYFADAHTGRVLLEFDEIETAGAVGRGRGALGDEKKVSATQTAGTFWTQDQLRPAEIRTLDTRGSEAALNRMRGGLAFESDMAVDSDNVWTNSQVVDAHVHTGWTFDYFFKRHGWAGMDGRSSRVFSVVADFRVLPSNAFFARPPFGPEGRGMVAFGETNAGRPITALDIVAHELMHGVTYFSVNRRSGFGLESFVVSDGVGPERIVLSNGVVPCERVVWVESNRTFPFLCIGGRFAVVSNHGGAINEAFSDVFGTSAEFFFQEPGSGSLRADYLMGEDIAGFGPIRSLNFPQSLRIERLVSYPDHFSRRLRFAVVIVEGTRTRPIRLSAVPLIFLDSAGSFFILRNDDNGGVHLNPTVLGHAFYLAIEGGRNATSGLTVQGVGPANREQIEKVFFRAMTEMMPSFPSFPMASDLLRQSARDLYGVNSTAFRAVDQALRAVGL